MTLNDAVDLMRNQLMLRKVQNMALSVKRGQAAHLEHHASSAPR